MKAFGIICLAAISVYYALLMVTFMLTLNYKLDALLELIWRYQQRI